MFLDLVERILKFGSLPILIFQRLGGNTIDIFVCVYSVCELVGKMRKKQENGLKIDIELKKYILTIYCMLTNYIILD